MPRINPTKRLWPESIEALRDEPARLVYAGDLQRLGLVNSYGGLNRLPEPVVAASGRLAWPAGTVLEWLATRPRRGGWRRRRPASGAAAEA
jgi:hypothetical protein